MDNPFNTIKDEIVRILQTDITLMARTADGNWSKHVQRNVYDESRFNEGRNPLIGVQTGNTTINDDKGDDRHAVTTFLIRGYMNSSIPLDRDNWEEELNKFAWEIIGALATSEDLGFSYTKKHSAQTVNIDVSSYPLMTVDITYGVEWFYSQDTIS